MVNFLEYASIVIYAAMVIGQGLTMARLMLISGVEVWIWGFRTREVLASDASV